MSKKSIKPITVKGAPRGLDTGYTAYGLFLGDEKLKSWVTVVILKIRDGKLILKGNHLFGSIGNYDCYFRDSEKRRYDITETRSVSRCYDEESGLTLRLQFFEAEIDIEDVSELQFCAVRRDGGNAADGGADDAPVTPKRMIPAVSYGRHGRIAGSMPGTYYSHGRYIVSKKDNRTIAIRRASASEIIKQERLYGATIREETGSRRLALIRLLALILRLLKKREIWIVTDRDNAAGDNGEALFKYLVKNEKDAKLYFAIDGSCPDYRRMKRYGRVLRLGTLGYYVRYMAADKLISSQTGNWVTNPFGPDGKYMRNMYDYDYVFLQHGIILNDLSDWFNYYRRDIELFVTSAKGEYEAVSDYGYCCTKRQVKLTGLPRYDYLHSDTQKKIVFMPTWRHDIAGPTVRGTSHRDYSETFKDSEYCRFFDSLINSPALLEAMRENGYTGELYIHPAFTVQARDFHGNDLITVSESVADYNRVFAESALMVTDYSSVAFDFVYLKKPVVYAQFDREDFYSNHHCGEGYFDFTRDGFGPVCPSLDSTVESVISYIRGGCVMEDAYRKRADGFFAFNDRNNCERVYAEIKRLNQHQ